MAVIPSDLSLAVNQFRNQAIRTPRKFVAIHRRPAVGNLEVATNTPSVAVKRTEPKVAPHSSASMEGGSIFLATSNDLQTSSRYYVMYGQIFHCSASENTRNA